MGCCHTKTSTATAPNILTNVPEGNEVCPFPLASAVPTHPCRLTEFDDVSFERRFMTQLNLTTNIRINSPFVTDPEEYYRQPHPHTMTLLNSKIIDKVEEALVTNLTTGRLRMVVDNGSRCSCKAVGFKNFAMTESQLSPAIIEAALTHIIDHLDEHPKLIAALGTAKIGYHNKGAMLDDLDVRVFVFKGFENENTTATDQKDSC